MATKKELRLERLSEKLATWKKSFSGYVGSVTRKHREFNELAGQASSATLDDLGNGITGLKEALKKLEDCKTVCVEVASEIDPDTVAGYDQKYEEMSVLVQDAERQYQSIRDEKFQDAVKPDDSVSQVSSHGTKISKASSTSSTRAKAAAKRASLLAKAKYLSDIREVELEQLTIDRIHMEAELRIKEQKKLAEMKLQELHLKAEIEAVSAEEQTLNKFMDPDKNVDFSGRGIKPSLDSQASDYVDSIFSRLKSNVETSYRPYRGPGSIARSKVRFDSVLPPSGNLAQLGQKSQSNVKQGVITTKNKTYGLVNASNTGNICVSKGNTRSVQDTRGTARSSVQQATLPDQVLGSARANTVLPPTHPGSTMLPPTYHRSDSQSHYAFQRPNQCNQGQIGPQIQQQPIQYNQLQIGPQIQQQPNQCNQGQIGHQIQQQPIQYNQGQIGPQIQQQPNQCNQGQIGQQVQQQYQVPSVSQSSSDAALLAQLQLQQQLLDVMRLPKASLKPFDGNPLHFWSFMNAFDSTVDRSSVSEGDKLARLLEYCIGDVEKVLEPCAIMDPRQGYMTARQLLKERFGDDHVIARSWVDKVVNGPPVKPNNPKSLQVLADEVRCCMETLRAMNKLYEVESQDRMVKIMGRLPLHLQTRWRKDACKVRDQTGRYPDFGRFVTFLNIVAKEANDPVFGKVGFTHKDQKGKSGFDKKKSVTLAADATSSDNPSMESYRVRPSKDANQTKVNTKGCLVCQGNHAASKCKKFQDMKPGERLDTAKRKGMCFNCLDYSNHMAQQCRVKTTCTVEGCGKRHASLLHKALLSTQNKASMPSSSNSDEVKEKAKGESDGVQATSMMCSVPPVQTSEPKCALPIVPVMVRGKGQTEYIETFAMLDPGSNRSFCSMTLVKKLNVTGKDITMKVDTMNKSELTKASEVTLEVTSTTGKRRKRKVVELPHVIAVKDFVKLKGNLVLQNEVTHFEHLKGLPLPSKAGEVTLLIGQNAPDALKPLETRDGGDGQPYAVKTALGWAVNGPVSNSPSKLVMCNFIQAKPGSSETSLETQVQQFWNLDHGHLAADTPHCMSVENTRAVKIWNDSIKLTDGHYMMDIPFRKENPELPDNRVLAEKRLQYLGKRLQKDSELHRRYSAGIKELLDKGYAEEVDPKKLPQDGVTWYLPHHNVINPNKPEKLRIVFDCAAEYDGASLNKNVLQGPDLTCKLLGVLLRFREYQVAIMGDVEAMYHQVRVSQRHRNALRFLWWKDDQIGGDLVTYHMNVHLFGGVWSPSCATFALRRTAEDNKELFKQEVVDTVSSNFYVDDCLKSVNTTEEGIHMAKELCRLLAKGGFRLTKWVSNDKEVLNSIPETEKAKTVKSLDLDLERLPVERALGVIWDTESDVFSIQIKPQVPVYTRRGLLRVVSSVYDPLGLISPVVLQAKFLLQQECCIKKGWDDPLEEQNITKWDKWIKGLQLLKDYKVRRCFIPSDFGEIMDTQLHHFADASQAAYGCVSYLRYVSTTGRIHCSFVIGKSRLAPLKHMTIPRLELQAAVLAVNVDCYLKKELRIHINKTVFWSDSQTVLAYINNQTRRFHTFVANRIQKIHDSSSADQWKYVNSASNPADDASRGLSPTELLKSERWIQGPDFLWKDQSHSPLSQTIGEVTDDDVEVKKEITCLAASKEEEVCGLDRLIKHYSSWIKSLRAAAWIMRFTSWLIKGKSKQPQQLSVEDIRQAEMGLVRYVQHTEYPEELNALSCGRQLTKGSGLFMLDPYIDKDGIMRVGGRLKAAPVVDETKFPAILPRRSHVSLLITRYLHEVEARHCGKEYVFALIRQKYWIPKVRPLIKQVIRECVTCKRIRAKPLEQKMADLPEDRVIANQPPFTNTGIDCFGPFYVKRGRSTEKRYGCIFTCLVMRAIHIEMLHSMEADSFINALMRFKSRRGVPKTIRSDNGTNFVRGNKEIRDSITEWNHNKRLQQWLVTNQIKWIFNPPAASHMGGVWEREIRSIRDVMKAITKDKVLDDERLSTLFCEIESVVNGRPLTVVSDDLSDPLPINPNMLLQLGQDFSAPPGKFTKNDVFTRRWRHVQYLTDLFWKRWCKEYLPTLQLRQKWFKDRTNVNIGDIVLVLDGSLPRNNWPLARVLDVHPGRDGSRVRRVTLKT